MDFSEIQIEIIKKVLLTDDKELLNKVKELLKDVHFDERSAVSEKGKKITEEGDDTYHKITELKANDKIFREIAKLMS